MGSRDWTRPHEKIRGALCRVCRDPTVDPAHIIPRSQVAPGLGENPDNIVPLCRRHHDAYDGGDLDLTKYLTRSEQATAVFLVGIEAAYWRIRNSRPENGGITIPEDAAIRGRPGGAERAASGPAA